ncbi:hypothetical protein EMIHUDRAFT_250655 [Emiliania huxleyi CCMP1516]|uniref:Uncharacterized protein n=2 Tax=Emiliania huxleyi TaxID=2903 RepID=A0A0D3HYU7_EMIH1|nr:hypothetical protein EMIHUDRAFT_250655 [Emiliania huxleyi CCMP1516]EOD04182.1 hypothetical protein EMIHUDRAFT_250655 [Emiliania huxleyi CCMP1516]|eukprot:XP_005756611.1 hypothetical protein EMIHUDRAFT_250655 [Emiliania huxleyi CCMP1516]
MDDPLLQGARALQASIAGEGLRLPPVSRSLQQIEDETRALASAAARAPAATAMAYRFLAQQGIDADGLDAATLDMAVDEASADLPAFGGGADATAVDAPACDVDSLLAREQCRALVESVRRAGELVTARYDAAYWSSFEEAWGGTRDSLLRDAQAASAVNVCTPLGPHGVGTGDDEGAVRVWDVRQRGAVMRFDEHSDVAVLGSGEAIEALAPLSEHALLLASADGVLRAASLHPSRMLGEVGRHADPIEALAVDAQGALAATAAHDGTVRLWDVSEAALGRRAARNGGSGAASAEAETEDEAEEARPQGKRRKGGKGQGAIRLGKDFDFSDL